MTEVYFRFPGSWLWNRDLTTSKGALKQVAVTPTQVPIAMVLHSDIEVSVSVQGRCQYNSTF